MAVSIQGLVTEVPDRHSARFAGRYTLERELGRGGMATVWLARDLKYDRPVALKVLRPEIAAALGPERFLREVQITARLHHPHILPLLDSGKAHEFLYYAMPYVEGESLRDRLAREKQLPLQDALQIAREVADALAYAHTQDVVHRDIKPENILLESGHAVVADFGIARAITAAGGERLTQTGVAVGTLAYMSPEQAMGEQQVDGRSDLYSLGCVLYEMLAGEPPYKGPTAQAILARRLTDPVPSLHTVRETVPAEVERAILKALAKVPADRFSTATQFSEALGRPATKSLEVSRRVVRWAALGTITMAVAVFFVLHYRSGGRVALDPNLIAVAPFNVRGAGLGLWSEGLVEYLSRSLDGAGELRTVSPSVFLHRWRGPADPASARDLGRRTGARLVVFGSLVHGGLDSVRLRATLFDAGGDQSQEIEVSGDTLAIDRVADSLAVLLLWELGRTRPVAAVRNVPFSAAPLPALKEFLRGEQFYRRGQYDSALAHHARAVALDSTFALAYERMSQDIGWAAAPTSGAFESADAYAFKAARFNRGLTIRDSLLIAADSCLRAAAEGSLPDWVAVNQRQFAVVNEAARRFPDDPEVWMALGEAGYHHLLHAGYQHPVYVGSTGYHRGGSPFESFGTPAEVLRAFETAIRLDPGFRPAYGHVIELTMQTGQADLARQYARAYLALNVAERNVTTLALDALLLDTARFARPELSRLIDTIAVGRLFGAVYDLRTWADSGETAIRLLRALPRGQRSVEGSWPSYWVDTLIWQQSLAAFLLYRGRAGEAYEVYRPLLSRPNPHSWAAWFWNPLRDLALLGAIPADTASAVIARSIQPEGIPVRNWLPWWFAQRDTTALERMIARTDRAASHTTSALERLLARYLRAAATGYVVLRRGDSVSALQDFDALPDTACVWVDCSLEKLTLARLLAARGDDRRAGEVLDRWLWIDPSPFFVVGRLERARIAEHLGDRDTAIHWYRFVANTWRHPDPELQPRVAEAQAGLRRLGGLSPR